MWDLSHFPKTDIRFWQKAVFRQPYTVDGQRRLTKEWYARVQYGGKRQFFSLGTPNKGAAAAKARDIYLSLVAAGWESTLARYKGAKGVAQAEQRQVPCTVGDFLDQVLRTASNQRTVEGYAKASGRLSHKALVWIQSETNTIIAMEDSANGWRMSTALTWRR